MISVSEIGYDKGIYTTYPSFRPSFTKGIRPLLSPNPSKSLFDPLTLALGKIWTLLWIEFWGFIGLFIKFFARNIM